MSSLDLVALGDVASVTGGLTKNAKRDQLPLKRPYLTVANVYANRLELDDVGQIGIQEGELARVQLRRDDLLIVEGNGSLAQLGRVALWTDAIEGCVHQNHLIKVRPSSSITPKWLLYWLLSPEGRRAIEKVGSSTSGLHTLSISKVQGLPVAVRPIAEQHRIVAAIETHLSRLGAAVASLKRAKANVKRARASVLKAAVEGRLVPTEAELARTEGRDYEPASTLLARILVKRTAAWTASGAKSKSKEAIASDTEGLPELPDGWRWTCMDALTAVTGGIAKNASRGTRDMSLPFLRVANVYADELRLDDVTEIQVSNSELPGFLLERDDLLIVEGNGSPEHLGRVALWNAMIAPCVHQNHLIKARSHGETHPRWLLQWFLSPNGRVRILATASSTSGLHTLSISKVKALQVPLPPLAEQHRIVAEVDRRLSVLDALDTTLDANLARCAKLRQSILKRAFEGKLVPADTPSAREFTPNTKLAPRSRAAQAAE